MVVYLCLCSVGPGSVGVGSVGFGSVGFGSVGFGSVGLGSVGAGSVGFGSVGPSVGFGSVGPSVGSWGFVLSVGFVESWGLVLSVEGSVASMLGKLLKFGRDDRRVLIMAGMSSVFAGLFGTPLTATLFTMEFSSVGTIFSPALLPCYLAAFTASRLSLVMGVHPEGIMLTEPVTFTATTNFHVLILAIAVGLLGIGMCFLLHEAEHLAAKKLPNPWLRIFLGGCVIAVLTLLVGDHRYNGAGMDMALGAVEGNANWYDFLMKLLFTAVTLAAGFKGGEIVPTFCIGATFGCTLAGLLGLDPGIGAALGLIGLFCCVTNSPIAAIILSVEMFGSTNLYLFAFVCVIAFVISGNWGLYASQIIQFSKARLVAKERK